MSPFLALAQEALGGELESAAEGRLRLWGDLTLSDPWFLLLVPAVLAALLLGGRRRRHASAGLPLLPPGIPASRRQRLAWLPWAMKAAAMLLTVAALARPLRGTVRISAESEGVDIVLLLDRSSSMDARAAEGAPRRFDIAKRVLENFARRRMTDTEGAADNVALVAFAGFAELLCPFTLNAAVLGNVLEETEVVQYRDLDGTRIGVAMARAVELYEDVEAVSKVAILLTDGLESENPPIAPLEAAQLASEAGVRVYVVFAGPREQLVRGPLRQYLREIDTSELERIAEITGAQFFHARDEGELTEVYAEIESLERRTREDERFAEHFDLYPSILLPAFVLYALGWLSTLTWARRLP